MRKIFTTFSILSIVLLSSCAKRMTNVSILDNTVSSKESNNINNNVLEGNENLANSTLLPTISDNPLLSAMQAIKEVLLNEKIFTCTDQEPYNNIDNVHQFTGYLKDIHYIDEIMEIIQFAVVDLDGNDIPEVLLAISEYNGFVILRYNDGDVYGNIVSYRSMYSQKKDGYFMSSGSSSDTTIQRMFFIGNTFFTDEYISSPELNSYYLRDIPIEQETWDDFVNSFNDSEDVIWLDYNIETVTQFFGDYTTNTRFESSCEVSTERQAYLDSLSYLIEMTYNYTTKKQEELNTDAIRYYTSSNDELNKMYQLCKDKLSNDELDRLIEEQEQWQNSFDYRISQFLIENNANCIDDLQDQRRLYFFGDIIIRRIFRLANIYYDYDFYD